MNLVPERLEVDLSRNTLRIVLRDRLHDSEPDILGAQWTQGTIDIGTRGRLIGLEFGDHYVTIAPEPHAPDRQSRSASIPIRIVAPSIIEVPRNHQDVEISFPSGNACWRTGSGETLCSVLVSPEPRGAGESR